MPSGYTPPALLHRLRGARAYFVHCTALVLDAYDTLHLAASAMFVILYHRDGSFQRASCICTTALLRGSSFHSRTPLLHDTWASFLFSYMTHDVDVRIKTIRAPSRVPQHLSLPPLPRTVDASAHKRLSAADLLPLNVQVAATVLPWLAIRAQQSLCRMPGVNARASSAASRTAQRSLCLAQARIGALARATAHALHDA
jgi:hypothetical protein